MKSELEFSGDMGFLDIWKAGGKYMIHGHLHGEITFYPCLFPTSSDKHITFQCSAVAAAKSLQSCLTLCDTIDGSPPGSPVPGTL